MSYKDPEKKKEYQKKYREQHKEQHKEYFKEYHLRNKERFRAKRRLWARDNADKVKEHSSKSYLKYRAKRIKKARDWNLRQIGWSEERYERVFEEQNGVCGICEKPSKFKKLAADHDHVNDFPRGLLCAQCNLQLGTMEKYINNPKVLEYRQKWGSV
jgi:hypothetical protein